MGEFSFSGEGIQSDHKTSDLNVGVVVFRLKISAFLAKGGDSVVKPPSLPPSFLVSLPARKLPACAPEPEKDCYYW